MGDRMKKKNVIVYEPLSGYKRKTIIYCPCFDGKGNIILPDFLDSVDVDELELLKYPSIQIFTKSNKKIINRIEEKFGNTSIMVFVTPIEHLIELFSLFDY